MATKSDQVQRLLETLARHADIIAEGFSGSIVADDKVRNRAIDELAALNAIRAYDEDSYRLNPRLREFIADHLLSFQAFERLTRISGAMRQARDQWSELKALKSDGAVADAQRLEWALDDTIFGIGEAVARNLAMLHSLVSSQYGNVDNLNSKIRQNRYYAKEVIELIKEVLTIGGLVDDIAPDATSRGMPHIRQLLRRQLGSRVGGWVNQIKDAQAVISKRLFDTRRLEERLRRLSTYSLWLNQNKGLNGWDVDIGEHAAPEIFRPEPMPVRPQVDARDDDAGELSKVVEAARRMPPPKSPSAKEPSCEPQVVVADTMEETDVALEPYEEAIEELFDEVMRCERPISLLRWKEGRASLESISEEAWLLYAVAQLQANEFDVDFERSAVLEGFPINTVFHDVLASRQAA